MPADASRPTRRTLLGLPEETTAGHILSPYVGLPPLRYPFHDHELVVARNGGIGLFSRRIAISTVFEGQTLGLREVDADVWLVSFMHYDLGYIDLEARRLQTIDTPFGSRVSPM